MKVIEFKEFGRPSQLKLAERPMPQADANTAVVRIEAASINPSDVKNVAGRMEQTTLPRVPGRDYSGVVVDGPKEWIEKEVWGTGGDVGFTRGECIEITTRLQLPHERRHRSRMRNMRHASRREDTDPLGPSHRSAALLSPEAGILGYRIDRGIIIFANCFGRYAVAHYDVGFHLDNET
jgi:hypothetical protein